MRGVVTTYWYGQGGNGFEGGADSAKHQAVWVGQGSYCDIRVPMNPFGLYHWGTHRPEPLPGVELHSVA